MSWASTELEKTDLGDARRKRRLVKIIEDLSAQPNVSLVEACRDNAALQGLYDFWSNPRIGSSQIISGHVQSTIERCKAESVVLAIQDTTELDFKNHKHKKGLGHLSNPNAKGLKVHTTLCVSSLGVPLGLIDKQVWAREKKTRRTSAQLRREPIENKESNCWLKGLKATNELIPEDLQVVTIADREADIFELFAQPRRNGSEFLIRACRRRSVKKDSEEIEKLQEAIAKTPIAGTHKIKLQRTPRRKPRPCTLTLRWTSLELQPPVSHPNRRELEPMVVNVLLAQEENPPPREKAVKWLLLTTLPVTNLDQAVQCLEWYSARWLIERYHYTLKSGCRLEQLQLEQAHRIEKALATYAIVAWRLLWLTYQARVKPEQTVEKILDTIEWEILYRYHHQKNPTPEEIPSISECVVWIAKLGGFLGRKSDGNPGVKTLWRGLTKLDGMVMGWQLYEQINSSGSSVML